jgi:hypothetical protein
MAWCLPYPLEVRTCAESYCGCGDPCTVLQLVEDASVVALALLLITQHRRQDRSTILTAGPPSQRLERRRDRRSPVEVLHNGFCQKFSLYHRTAVSNVVADQWIDERLRLVQLYAWQTFLCSTGVVVVPVRTGWRAEVGQGKIGLYGDAVHQSAEI